jgi:hypothetical protein
MVGAITQSTNNEICDAVNHLVMQFKYFSPSDKDIQILLDLATKLIPVEPSNGNARKGSIYLLCGDFEKGLHHIKVANNKLPGSNAEVLKFNSAITVSNHYFYLESQKYIDQIKKVTEHEPFEIINVGYGCLAFNKLKELIMDARRFEMSIDEKASELALRAAAVFESAGITDAEVAKYADVFGEVLRENQLMIGEECPTIKVGDSKNNWNPPTVFVVFRIKTSPERAADLYAESVERALVKFGSFPDALHLSMEAI